MGAKKTYCLYCGRKTGNKSIRYVTTQNDRRLMKSICTVCGNKKSEFVAATARQQKGGGLADKFMASLSFKAHLPVTYHPEPYQSTDPSVKELKPGQTKLGEYIGPGTRYDARYARGERGLNDLDHAAMFHDLAYKSKDPATRNRADVILTDKAEQYLKKPGLSNLDKVDANAVILAMRAIKRKT